MMTGLDIERVHQGLAILESQGRDGDAACAWSPTIQRRTSRKRCCDSSSATPTTSIAPSGADRISYGCDERMRVLILSQFYAPEPTNLLPGLASELCRLGHHVQVLTGFPNYPSGTLYPGYRLRPWQKETLDGVPVVRTFLYPNHSRSALLRILNYLSFTASSAMLGPLQADRPDVIFVLSTPYTVGISAWLISRIWGVPFVFDVQDLWPETLEATGMLRSSLALRVVGRLARWVYDVSAAMIVISDGMRTNLIAKGVPPSKIKVVSNWVDTELYRPCNADPDLSRQLGLAGRFNVVFRGEYGRSTGTGDSYCRGCGAAGHPHIQFVFVGDGVAEPHLRSLVDRLGLKNVRFLGRFPESAIPSILALSDVLLVHLRDSLLFRITVPHKIHSYLACGKPIVCAVSGDATAIIMESSSGEVCPPGDPVALAGAVQHLFELPSSERQKMGERARQAAVQKYSAPVLIKKIEQVLEDVSAGGIGGNRRRASSASRPGHGLYARFGKRLFDLCVSLVAIVAFAPIIAIVALVSWLVMGSPILFRHQRPGLHTMPFLAAKFPHR